MKHGIDLVHRSRPGSGTASDVQNKKEFIAIMQLANGLTTCTLSSAHAKASSGSLWSTQKPVSTLDTSPLFFAGVEEITTEFGSFDMADGASLS